MLWADAATFRPALDELRELAYDLTLAEARECERVARSLNDEVGQVLTLAQRKLGEIRLQQPPASAALTDELAALLTQASIATRAATAELNGPLLQQGLQPALESMVPGVAQAGQAQWRVAGRATDADVPEAVLGLVLRVVRELVLNVHKHAAARHAVIRVRCDARALTIAVVDDGQGFDPAQRSTEFDRNPGFGLIRARAQMFAVGGRLEIDSTSGVGTRAKLVLPLPHARTRGPGPDMALGARGPVGPQ